MKFTPEIVKIDSVYGPRGRKISKIIREPCVLFLTLYSEVGSFSTNSLLRIHVSLCF
jgi:hypothetical protein